MDLQRVGEEAQQVVRVPQGEVQQDGRSVTGVALECVGGGVGGEGVTPGEQEQQQPPGAVSGRVLVLGVGQAGEAVAGGGGDGRGVAQVVAVDQSAGQQGALHGVGAACLVARQGAGQGLDQAPGVCAGGGGRRREKSASW
ncbi:hypothetical protein [Streptomyces ardesiacus]|uniref:hypothetical protein n=1 Tax=Streptomyces ardesiacus TaxID=285564 RepID=UPI003679683F